MAAGVSSGTPSKLSISAGARVCCTTCNGKKIEGEVLAFDLSQKILILKLTNLLGAKTCDINFINTDLLQAFSIIEESKKTSGPLPAIDMVKIGQRLESNLHARKKASERVGVGVSPIAQRLFDCIAKTLDPCWDSTKIIVMDVIVSSPYTPDDCAGDSKSIDHVRKIVEKFHAEKVTV